MRTLQLAISLGASLVLLSVCACGSGRPPQVSSASTGSGGSMEASSSGSSGGGGATAANESTASGAGGSVPSGGGAPAITQIALGVRHSCARKATGELHCWGDDDHEGALGSGSKIGSSPVPLQVKDTTGFGYLAGVTDFAAGFDHTCAILSSGKLVCFGLNIQGQLGDGSGKSSSIPVTVKGVHGVGELADVTKIACGSYLTCAIAGGGVYCWGLGGLGDGTKIGSQVPVQVLDSEGAGPFTNAVEIGIGEEHVCIRRSDTTLHCFGNNANGQTGDGSTKFGVLPTQVKNLAGQAGYLSGVDEIARSGASHTCARLGGAVACWGEGDLGELGVGAPDKCVDPCAKLPGLVPGIDALNPAVEITSGSEHTCARLADGSVVCWGGNTFLQLGAAVTGPCPGASPGACSLQPVTVVTPSNVPFVAAHIASGSGQHTCAIDPDGSVWCWGQNAYGQLGDGTSASSIHPVPVVGL